MKLTQKQLRQLINEAIQGRRPGEPEPFAIAEALEVSRDEKHNAWDAEQTLRSLARFFNDDEVTSKAFELVMKKLSRIQEY